MAARKNKGTKETGWPQQVRERIQASMLVNRLLGHALGECEMTPTQVRAAEVLLRKALPDLSAAEITQETTVRYVARVPDKKPDAQAWHQQHAPSQPILQ